MQGRFKNLNSLSRSALACAVCFGDSKSPLSKGVVAGVLTLAGIIVLVLAAIAATAWSWWRRSRKISN